MQCRIVVVDDEPLSLTNAKNLLTSENIRVSCLRSGADLLKFMEKNTPDLILLDILMPEMDGFETYKALRAFEKKAGRVETPVIFLTGDNNSESERRGLKVGASDYIRKPFDKDILTRRIYNTISNNKMIESLTEEATVDKLTGFYNKSAGTEKISAICEKTPGALMVFDLDNFKLVNDLFGHDMGDRVLVAFSEIVKNTVRPEDVVSRIGGDEFMGFFPNMTAETAVEALTRRLNEQLCKGAAALMGAEHGISLGVSVGVVFTTEELKDYTMLFQCADSVLYKVKQNGKHGYEIYDPNESASFSEKDLTAELVRVVQIVSERGEGTGAMLLGSEAFSWNYRFIMRFMHRYGGSVSKILFALSATESDVLFSEMVAEFGNILQKKLRKSDIVFQCKADQFFVVLSHFNESDALDVIARIKEAWARAGYASRVKIDYTISEEVIEKEIP